MQIRTLLEERIRARGLSRAKLSKQTRTSRGVIGDLCGERWQRIGRDTIARICEELDITSLDDLFQLYDTNIFFPIRLHREVTIHFGSSGFFSILARRLAMWLSTVRVVGKAV